MSTALCFTAEGNLESQSVRLLATNRSVVEARVSQVEPAPYDHVIWTVDDLPAESGGYHLNAFSGFTPASARVNCKANTYSTGLLSETAIVP